MLETYQKKRDFRKTREPAARENGAGKGPDELPPEGFFIIQKHAASRLHYDLRLACEGVLKSWAVPKGPSLNPADKRLAVQTEDHPLEYARFEGTIPKGEYGGGTVMLWDRGRFAPLDGKDACAAIAKGKLKFHLEGERLHGAFELVRMSGQRGEEGQWLLLKLKDEEAESGGQPIVDQASSSVATGRSMQEIADDAPPRDASGDDGTPPRKIAEAAARSLSKPPAVKPQLATLSERVPDGDGWFHEIKWDGYRLLAEKHQGRVRLWTRQRKDWTEKFPSIEAAVRRLPLDSCVLDGELVALDDDGRSNFQTLQNALREGRKTALHYYVFDLPYAAGKDLRELPLEQRKEALAELLDGGSRQFSPVLYSDHITGQGDAFFGHACDIRLEGVICKRRKAPYASTRNRDWLKVKCIQRQEFVICGYTPPSGSRKYFGALILAVREGEGWRYTGRVGTGFDQATLAAVHQRLEPLTRKTSPLPAADQKEIPKGAVWVTPKLVAEVAFTEATEDGRLRHPSFQGLREDKPAEEVRWEKPSAPPPPAKNQKKTAARKRPASPERAEIKAPEKGQVAGIRISHPDREVFPSAGFTKAQLAAYYERAAERMLPYLAHRPLSLLRCPRGVGQQCFFQKHFRQSVPAAVELIEIAEKSGKQPYSYLTDARGIVSLAQYGVLEFHPWGSRIDRTERPDVLIFDLDPDEGVSWSDILQAAFTLRDFLADLGLTSFVNVSGGKGLHLRVPIERRNDWGEVKDFCHQVALRLAEREPRRWVAQASKAKRKGKVFLDYLRNGRGATGIAPYSVRARQGAPVALPVAWDEVDEELRPNAWNLESALARIEQQPDPWADFLTTRQSLTKAMRAAVAS